VRSWGGIIAEMAVAGSPEKNKKRQKPHAVSALPFTAALQANAAGFAPTAIST